MKLESGFQFGLIWFLMQGVRAYRLISKASVIMYAACRHRGRAMQLREWTTTSFLVLAYLFLHVLEVSVLCMEVCLVRT